MTYPTRATLLAAALLGTRRLATAAPEPARRAFEFAYGFRSYDHIETTLYHRLGNLPEPDWLTHRFF